MSLNRIRVSDNFLLSEFECPHCRVVRLEPELIHALERLRHVLHDHPIIIESGYRCKPHNIAIYKAINAERVAQGKEPYPVPKRSIHTLGAAVDLANHRFTEDDIDELHRLGFNGIGLGTCKTHLDVREGPLVKWSYDD